MARTRRPRYEVRHPELDRQVEELVARAEFEFGRREGSEMVRQMVVTALRLFQEGTAEGDLRMLNSALKELRHALRVFKPYDHVRKVAVFGSARTEERSPEWEAARAFAARMVEQDWMVITGAGDGIMGAAQGGAGRHASFGVNIRLPFEQRANEVIAGDQKLINFRYFFTRKVTFVKEAHAIALFPGGFGTHDEGFEALTLIQTGKSEIIPVVFVDAPGGTYWKEWASWLEANLGGRGLIGPEDRSLFHVTDDVDDAVREITRFYRNYHSSRYVRELLVLRVRQAPAREALERLRREFGDICAGGTIEVRDALPEEGDEVAHLPRIVLPFDHHRVGRLRQLIDRLNELAEPTTRTTRDATPHEIVPQDIPPEARAARES